MRACRVRGVVLVLADAVLLWLLHPSAAVALTRLSAPSDWLRHDGADRVATVLAAAGLWCVAAWVALGLLAAALTRTPGVTGRVAGRWARVALPYALQRIVVGSAGLGVLLAPVTPTVAHATTPAPDGSGGRPVAAAPAWHRGTSGTPLPGPSWPGSGAATGGLGASPSAPGPPETHLVRPDESLWLLGAQRLGPHASDAEIAAYVPDLYRANRDVIGDDPDLVRPGQLLTLPPPHIPE